MGNENYKKIFSQNLKRLMETHNVKQNDLIEDLNLSSATISSWVNGLRMPRMDKIQELAEYFGVTEFMLLAKPYDILVKEVTEKTEDEENELLENYRKLNTEGREEARKQVNNLTKIKDYTEIETPHNND